MAVADPALERDAPLPANIVSNRPRDRDDPALVRLAGHGKRPVGGEPLRPVVERLRHRVTEEKAPEPGAVDEQVG